MKGDGLLTFLAYLTTIPFIMLFFMVLPFLGIQHLIQHWRGKQSWIDDWSMDDVDDYDYV